MVIKIVISIVLFIHICVFCAFSQSSLGVELLSDEVLANDDYATTNMLQPVIIDILTNDYGLGDEVTVTITTEPEKGTVEVLSDNALQYTPGNLHVDEESFVYQVCNSSGECDEATVVVAIIELDIFPNLYNDTIVIEGLEEEINVLYNDSNLYNRPLDFQIETQLNYGMAEIVSDSIIAVTMDADFYGIDSLSYTICDSDGDCASAWLFIDTHLNKGVNIFIPQGISPNGDGYNDVFLIKDLEDYEFSLRIINRWGKLIYTNDSYQNNWDGIANKGANSGNKLPVGTYYYYILVKETNWEYKGFIYLNY